MLSHLSRIVTEGSVLTARAGYRSRTAVCTPAVCAVEATRQWPFPPVTASSGTRNSAYSAHVVKLPSITFLFILQIPAPRYVMGWVLQI